MQTLITYSPQTKLVLEQVTPEEARTLERLCLIQAVSAQTSFKTMFEQLAAAQLDFEPEHPFAIGSPAEWLEELCVTAALAAPQYLEEAFGLSLDHVGLLPPAVRDAYSEFARGFHTQHFEGRSRALALDLINSYTHNQEILEHRQALIGVHRVINGLSAGLYDHHRGDAPCAN